jgi:hypothetical protein
MQVKFENGAQHLLKIALALSMAAKLTSCMISSDQ